MSDKSEYGCYVKLKQFLQQNNITPPLPKWRKNTAQIWSVFVKQHYGKEHTIMSSFTRDC